MDNCYSIRACKQNLYVTDVCKKSVFLGPEKDRLLFYDETEAENYRALCDETMDDCFQLVEEKEQVVVSDVHFGLFSKVADSVLWKIIMNLDTDDYAIANKLFEVYQETTDKSSFEKMFQIIFGVSFSEYLEKCAEATQNSDN